MRLTVARDSATELDLEVPAGGRLGDLRAPLAATSGWPELADPSIALAVDAVVVDDDQLTGQVPLLAGATLRVGRGTVPADRAALDAHWHVAVLSGPDCGALRGIGAPGSRDRVVVGRDLEADLVIDARDATEYATPPVQPLGGRVT